MQSGKQRSWFVGGLVMLVLGVGAIGWQGGARNSAGADAAPVEAKVATIDTFRCLQVYMQRPDMIEAREAQNAQLAQRDNEIRTRITTNQNKLRILSQGDPQFAMTQQAIQADSQLYNEFRQQAAIQAQALAVAQSTEAFLAFHEAAARIASELGYTHLISAKLDHSDLMGEDGPTIQNTSAMIQELLARSVLLAPEGDDITERVLEDMGIKQYEAEEEAQGPIEGPVPNPGGG